ncbi:MAG: SDR family NAD(P)-dependent oxidoreductase [Planctomycetaceae bacterium]
MARSRTAFITGVSTGIGAGLAEELLKCGWNVTGLSRREPEWTVTGGGILTFQTVDVSDLNALSDRITKLLNSTPTIDLAVLNAGVEGVFGDLEDATLNDLKSTMDINVWSNKLILDAMFRDGRSVRQVVTVSSGASVSGNRGWSGYSISKSALNMLTKLYAAERSETHFCALAPGVVDTPIQDRLLARDYDPRYETIETLRRKRGTDEMPGPREAARRLLAVFEKLPQVVPSGDFADIRNLPPH